MPTRADYEKQIGDQFPALASLYRGIPELWNVLVWSVAAGLGAQQAQEAIQNTTYYKTHNDAQMHWAALAATDPGQAVRLQQQYQQKTLLAGARLGANLTHDQLALFSQQAVENNYTDQELQDSITGFMANDPTAKRAPGEFTAAMTKVRNIADQYAMPVGDKEAADLASRFLLGGSGAGGADETSLADLFKTRAETLYPSLKKQLDAGVTVQQWAQPYKTIASQELGVSADSITFNDPKWKAMLDGTPVKGKEGEQGAMKPLSLADWQTKLRTDQQYGFKNSVNGVQAAQGIVGALRQTFGKDA